MNRRDFLAAASSLVIPVTVNGFSLKTFDRNSGLVQSLTKAMASYSDRILVIVYLGGGNDGLNTVIPVEHYAAYDRLRNNIAIPEKSILPLSGNPETGFHPAMKGMQQMYNEGKLAIIHSVSYPDPTQSHVRSTEIWMTGVDADKTAPTGWAGRYLDDRFPGYPESYPNPDMDDPLALQIGYINSTSLLGSKQAMGISLVSPDNFYQLVGQESHIPANDLSSYDTGSLVKAIRQQQILAIEYGAEIKKAADLGKNSAGASYDDGNELSQQLKIVGRLINGGLKTKIYYVEMTGFDTHAAQVSNSSTTEGDHAILLRKLSDAISTFQTDLKLQGVEDKVIGMTFSDFGRRATSNASKGTDHGVAAPMFVFGTGIKRQIIGTNPDLVNDLVPLPSAGSNINHDIKMQIDFRRIYADLIKDWFGAEQGKTDALLFKNFKTVSLFSSVSETISSGNWGDRSIWSSGYVPGAKDHVKINQGHIVEVSQIISAKHIEVEGGGELLFLGNF